jgi:glutamyl-tRNA reductase
MTLMAIGVNHRTAPLEVLEQVSFAADAVPLVLKELVSSDVVNEAVVLSTCNRTEIYVHAERFHDGFRDVREVLARLSGVEPSAFDPYLYVHYHGDAAHHLFEVAAGLDSVVLGEHEILGQVSRAWELARNETVAGPLLNLLFQRAVESGKKVRTDTSIGRSTASLAHAAVALLQEHREDLASAAVLLVGAGELGADVARALRRKHPVDLVVTNRTPGRAAELVDQLGGRTVAFDQLRSVLAEVDVVITATGAAEPVIGADLLAQATARGHRLLVADLALPRDVAVEAGLLPAVDLIDLTQLQEFANRGIEARLAHVGAARAVVEAELERYRAASSARQAAPLIRELHSWADGLRAAELDRYAAKLAAMTEADRATVEALSRSLVAKLLHQPTITLRQAAGTARGDRLAETVQELFKP